MKNYDGFNVIILKLGLSTESIKSGLIYSSLNL